MKYTVKDTHIRHCDRTYGPGDVIELSEEEAVAMAHHLERVAVAEEPVEPLGDDNSRRRRR